YWYKFTKKDATKEKAILEMCGQCDLQTEEIIAFGDDFADIGMLQLCGTGIAMGNAIEEVKAVADRVIGSNDEDGIARYLEEYFCNAIG
ncbi:MAG: HAD hydrolase family protein, partial [Lachnospiraceae bacterium]|nr:HAD hydrolase family protein [Lachnospiraceae bacterium]